MIIVDPRNGSRELYPKMVDRGLECQLSPDELPAGDFCWEGNGPDGRCMVGVERSTVRDLLNKIRTGRFGGGQLPAMTDMYKYRYLIVEGIYRRGGDGILEEPRNGQWQPVMLGNQRFMFQEIEGAINTWRMFGNVFTEKTSGVVGTIDALESWHHWWTCKLWSQHSAHQVRLATHTEIISPWPLVRVVANDLPGIGQGKSLPVAQQFRSVRRMVNSLMQDWTCIPGVGKKIAATVVEAMDKESY